MLFTDSFFLFYFLPSALFALWITNRVASGVGFSMLSKAMLFALTLAFYGCQEVWWLLPFTFCLFFDFVWATLLVRVRSVAMRKVLVALSVAQNLGLLGLFKYWPFIRQSFVAAYPASQAFLPNLLFDAHAIVLPAGISFYTFESLSFVIDVYRREVTPPKNILDFAAFIAMFPRFVAGPIVRYREIESQYKSYRGLDLERGFYLFLCGFCLKTLFADHFALFTDYAFANDGHLGFAAAWIGVFAYTLQIYFDFSGYSLMAIGLGWCLGFEFPDNFNRPYVARTLQDFWRRWHMTLSRWLRDYLYIPLGGSRVGPFRTYLNLVLTMAIGGIWHGAGWTFLIWGAWHGVWLALERRFPRLFGERGGQARTFVLVMVGWVFFRAQNLPQALQVLRAMANPLDGLGTFNPSGFQAHPLSLVLCGLGVLYCFFVEPRVRYQLPNTQATAALVGRFALGIAFVFSLILNFSSLTIPFLYFQF